MCFTSGAASKRRNALSFSGATQRIHCEPHLQMNIFSVGVSAGAAPVQDHSHVFNSRLKVTSGSELWDTPVVALLSVDRRVQTFWDLVVYFTLCPLPVVSLLHFSV